MRPTRMAVTIMLAGLVAAPLLRTQLAAEEASKPTYAGVANCQMCHSDVHKAWQDKSHARAFDLLVAAGQEKNEKCLPCHTTGFGEGGFVDSEKTPGLKNVGCEACHGPGSQHNGDKTKITRTPSGATCAKCHLKTDIH